MRYPSELRLVRICAAWMLATFGQPHCDLRAPLIFDPSNKTKRSAAELLARLGYVTSADTPYLKDDESVRRRHARLQYERALARYRRTKERRKNLVPTLTSTAFSLPGPKSSVPARISVRCPSPAGELRGVQANQRQAYERHERLRAAVQQLLKEGKSPDSYGSKVAFEADVLRILGLKGGRGYGLKTLRPIINAEIAKFRLSNSGKAG